MLPKHHLKHQMARKRGISMYLFIGSLPVIIGMTGLVVDLTHLYTRRAIAQRAADAAALAGSMVSDTTGTNTSNDSVIDAEAKKYSLSNGYTNAQTTVDPHVGGQLGKVQVTVARNEQVYFTPLLEMLLGDKAVPSRRVAATAVAEKIVRGSLSLGGNYGTTTGASNPAAFGPYALHSYGDPYSVLYHDNGDDNDANHLSSNKGTGWDSTSKYNPDGFTYSMKVSNDFAAKNSVLKVQLYDPDGYDPKDGQSLDEIHADYAPGHPPDQPETTTKYTIYKVQSDGSLKEIATQTYGKDPSVDAATLKGQGKNPWVTPDGFKVNLNTYGPGDYKIRVKTLNGSSENGYNLRAGPDYTEPEVKTRTDAEWNQLETDWNNQYGDKGGAAPQNIQVPITADGKLQMNFTRTAPVKVRLAYLPASVAGKQITVTKFDTDVGSNSITYSYVQDGSSTFTPLTDGNTYLDNRNDYWSVNTVNVPADFKGGYWFAEYNAGQNDTSSWSVTYPGAGDGSVRLTR